MKSAIFIFLLLLAVHLFTPKIFAQENDLNIFINEFLANPEGTDTGQEWVELYNNSEEVLDLSSWIILTTSDTGSIRQTVLPTSTTILPKSFLIVSEFNVLDPNINFINVGSGKLNMFNTGVKISLLDKDKVVVDELAYGSAPSGISFELTGPLCHELKPNPKNTFTLGTKNDSYLIECWEEILPPVVPTIQKIIFSIDNLNWYESIDVEGPVSLFLDYNLSDNSEVVNTKWFIDNVEITNPVSLQFLENKQIKLEITLESGTILEALSNPVNIRPPYTLKINEIYPSPEATESEWLEIVNYGQYELDLSGVYLKDAGNNPDGYGNSVHTIADGILKPGEFFLIDKPKTTLNNSGDTIALFTPSSVLLNSQIYTSVSNGSSWARNIKDEFEITTYLTPGAKNIFLTDMLTIIPINDTETYEVGEYVKVSGMVSVDKNLLGEDIFYIQDNTAGIKIKLDFDMQAKEGQRLEIIAKVSENSDGIFLTLDNLNYIKILGQENVTPQNLTQDLDSFLNELVTVKGIIEDNYSTSFDMILGDKSIRVSFLSSTGITIPEKSKDDEAIITGILVFKDDKYYLYPRKQIDVTITTKPDPSTSLKVTSASSKKATTSTKKTLGALTTASKPENPVVEYKLPSNEIYQIPSSVKSQHSYLTTNVYLWPLFLTYLIAIFAYCVKKTDIAKVANEKISKVFETYFNYRSQALNI